MDDGDPLDLVPIMYNILMVLQEAYMYIADSYLIVTRIQRAKAGLPAPTPQIHGAKKSVNPNLKPETQAKHHPQTPGRRPLNVGNTPSPAKTPVMPGTPRTPINSQTPNMGVTPGLQNKSLQRFRLPSGLHLPLPNFKSPG